MRDLEAIKSNWRAIIPTLLDPARLRVNGEASYICPRCGHGENGDGLTFIPGTNTLKCHGCGWAGDIVDLYQLVNGCGFTEAIEALADYGAGPASVTATNPQREKTDFSQYFITCQKRLTDPAEGHAAREYLKGRGISPLTAALLGLGYDPAADMTTDQNGQYKEPRIIIPTSAGHYVGAALRSSGDHRKMNRGRAALFNAADLAADTVFIVEGWADAAALKEIGRPAVALNSINNAELLRPYPLSGKKLIIALDNEDAPNVTAAKEKIARLATEKGAAYVMAQLPPGIKDANAYLIVDRNAFISWAATVEDADPAADTADPAADTAHFIRAGKFAEAVELFRQSVKIKTGFPSIDGNLGGLYAGLHILAGISSLGKTTLALQIADNAAASGHEVLYFSLEQSTAEIVAKSLSRFSGDEPKSAYEIRTGASYAAEAVAYVAAVGDRVHVVEAPINGCRLSFIGERIRQHIAAKGSRPLVIIDYLQLIQSDGSTKSAKENADLVVTGLKQLSRDYALPILAISSMNRANYAAEADFTALKESGAIEYSADSVIVLQLAIISLESWRKLKNEDEKRAQLRAAKERLPRQIDAVCLKNRSGRTGWTAALVYYPNIDTFQDCAGAAAVFDEPAKTLPRL